MSRVLIVEDEAVLRLSLARGIGRLPGVDVDDAANVDDALVHIDRAPPDVIITDIDMPGRTGIELLGEVGKRGLRVPIIFVSAYLRAYGALIPRHADIDVLEKPVALEEIRQLVQSKLARRPARETDPFTVVDFLQLAGMSRRTVRVEATWENGTVGSITVYEGQVWHAAVGELVGPEGFARIAWGKPSRVRCRAVAEAPPARNLEGTVEALLMASAKAMDEKARDHGEDPLFVERAVRYSSVPPEKRESDAPSSETVGEETHIDDPFNHHLDTAMAALLVRDYRTTWTELVAAESLQPDHRTVRTNLSRLREMGLGDQGDDT